MKKVEVKDPKRNMRFGEFEIRSATNAYWIFTIKHRVFDAPPDLKGFINAPIRCVLDALESAQGPLVVRRFV